MIIKQNYLLLMCLAIFSLASCNQEEAQIESTTDAEISQSESDFNLDVEMENGMLKFEDFQSFQDALEHISHSEKRFFSEQALNDWESDLGFNSLRKKMQVVEEAYDAISDENSLNSFKANYSEFVNVDEEYVPELGNKVLASILNEEGKVIIDRSLHLFTNESQIVILDKDETKLDLALKTLTTDEDDGIYVFDYIRETEERGQCGKKRSCEDTNGSSNGSKRVKGKWELQFYASPVWNSSCGCYTNWNYTIDYYCEMQAHKKRWWGWKKEHGDDISWSTGYGVSSGIGSITHGTGWTQNSWEITYFKRLFPIVTGPFVPAPNVSYQFTYNGNDLNNLDASNCDCDDDCF